MMKGKMMISFRTAPCTKPSTSKTTTEIYVFKEIFNRTAKIYKEHFLKVVTLICFTKRRLTGSVRSSSKSENMFMSLKNKISVTFFSNFARYLLLVRI